MTLTKQILTELLLNFGKKPQFKTKNCLQLNKPLQSFLPYVAVCIKPRQTFLHYFSNKIRHRKVFYVMLSSQTKHRKISQLMFQIKRSTENFPVRCYSFV